MYLNLYGPCLIIKSEKTKQVLCLATDLNGLYLETSFIHSENLKNMGDDFWSELFELKKFGGFEYIENSGFSDETKEKYPELFYSYKNTFFLLFRKYILSFVENDNNIDLGTLKVTWEAKNNFIEIIEEICFAFKSMYKMNYKLWKITDLKK